MSKHQELALQLNTFYRDMYRRMMKWLTLVVVVCAILTVILAWMTYDRTQPKYFAAVTTGAVLPMHALSEPVITSDFIIEWAALTARMIYNLDFSKYQQQLEEAKPRFTPDGWNKMVGALKSSGFLSRLVNNRLMVSSVVSGSPVITARMIMGGRFTWQVQMKLLIMYTSASTSTQREELVTMNVQRVPTLDSSQGIQVMDFSAKPAQA